MSVDSFFPKRIAEHIDDIQGPDILAFKRFYAYILICASVILLSMAISVNFYSETYDIIPVLIAVCILFIFTGVVLYYKPNLLMAVQLTILLTSCVLGLILLTHKGTYNPAVSLVWFVMFSSMIMFTLGLYYGTLLFFSYFILLSLLLLLPYDVGINENITHGSRIRLLLAMFGTFLYSWGAEYVRYKTQLALTDLLIKTNKLARTDALTGLRNRHDFQNILDTVISMSESTRQPFALVLMDMDHFKKVNDTYGHNTGDLVLKHSANILISKKRSGDFLFRWGGEEFVLIIPDITEEKVSILANRMREYIANNPFKDGDIKISYTISMGIYIGYGKEGKKHIMKIADANLYKAKESGRNCIVI